MRRAAALSLAVLSVVLVIFVAPVASVSAVPLLRDDVPEPLLPWIDWVLHGREEAACPFLDGSGERRCAWPARLALALDERGGRFTQSWRMDARAWVPLPGDARRWPQDVTIDGDPAPVAPQGGVPGVFLDAGDYGVAGAFLWDALPESLPVPVETGLLSLELRGAVVPAPERDGGGTLWLERRAQPDAVNDRLELAAHRMVVDDVPLLLVTRIELGVSGKSREEVLGKVLPDGFVPLSLDSPLPARVEPDSRLRVQVRPGTWVLTLTARGVGPRDEITRPAPDGPWPDGDEIWAFQARPELRQVSVQNRAAVDPQQTTLPEEWKHLPAWRLPVGESLRLVERGRGVPPPPPDRLTLARELWLDFDGGGYTVTDDITGTLARSWRLEMAAPAVPGRVALDGRDVFITRGEGGRAGVELRRGPVVVSADSRIEGDVSEIAATGWDVEFLAAAGTLHLPPGWRLLYADGADEITPTWVGSFALHHVFLILVVVLAAWRLLGWVWAVVALLTLGLSVVEPGAPRWAWLVVLAAEALVRLLREGRVRRLARVVRGGAAVALVVLAALFVAADLQAGLFPAAAKGATSLRAQLDVARLLPEGESDEAEAGGWDEPAEPMAAEPFAPSPSPAAGFPAAGPPRTPMEHARRRSLSSGAEDALDFDPDIPVQTGPGLPSWERHNSTVHLRWTSPIAPGQPLRLCLLGPTLNLVLAFLRSGLVALFVLGLLRFPKGVWPRRPRVARPTLAALAALALLAVAPAARAQALPPPDLLQDLADRLTEPPECAPTCASIQRMALEIGPQSFAARLEVSAAAATAVPLPGRAPDVVADLVLLDDEPAPALLRDAAGVLWIALPAGLHEVRVSGRLPARDSVPLALPRPPRHVTAAVTGWRLDGLHEDGVADDTLVLSRAARGDAEAGAPPTALQPSALPPFVRVERTLLLGLRWRARTTVVRVSPLAAPVVLDVPLLPGESVTTAGIRVAEGKAQIQLAPGEGVVTWESVLDERPYLDGVAPLRLSAAAAPSWTEVWRLDVAPLWHVALSGIPAVRQFDGDGARRPEWRPWPGEEVAIVVTRPEGLPGQALTVDSSRLELTPGSRSTAALLSLTLRSSFAGEHAIHLPEGAELESLSLDGVPLPARQEGTTVVLPLARGAQTFQLAWRQPEGIAALLRTPAIDVGAPGVNADVVVTLPDDRWVLAAGGPSLGPAVQAWALLVVALLVALALGRTRATPLRWWHWALLGFGLLEAPFYAGPLVVAWLLALGWRARRPDLRPLAFDLRQVLLAALTAAALLVLGAAVMRGLALHPDMGIAGNDSTSLLLRWTADRTGSDLPQAWVFSLPLWVFRVVLLAWALWLVVALVGWLRWGQRTFGEGGLWRSLRSQPPPPASTDEPGLPAGPRTT